MEKKNLPSVDEIKSLLLHALYLNKDDGYCIETKKAYVILGRDFETSDNEINEIYPSGLNKFQTDIRIAVERLRKENIILDFKDSGRGIWKLSPNGIIEARKLYIETFKEDPHKSQDEITKSDIEQIENENNFSEGQKKNRLSSYYERKGKIRTEAINIHGLKCMVCDFDFSKTYGELGKGFIEVHHIVPISSFDTNIMLIPKQI